MGELRTAGHDQDVIVTFLRADHIRCKRSEAGRHGPNLNDYLELVSITLVGWLAEEYGAIVVLVLDQDGLEHLVNLEDGGFHEPGLRPHREPDPVCHLDVSIL